jgi:hypothetical protein
LFLPLPLLENLWRFPPVQFMAEDKYRQDDEIKL